MSTIVIFHPSSELYGSDRILVNALSAMPRATHKRVYLLSEGPLIDLLYRRVDNIQVVVCPQMPVLYRKIFTPKGILNFMMIWLKFIFFMRKEHRQFQFESAYVNTLSNAFILPILVICRIKCFIHVHEIVVRPWAIGKLTALLAAWFANDILCVSEAVANNLKSYNRKIERKIKVIHNGIEGIAVGERDDNVLSFSLFGRIMPQKGQWLVVEALSKIPPEKLKRTRFTFMGGVLYNQQSVLEDLETKIKEANLNQVIQLKSFSPNICKR